MNVRRIACGHPVAELASTDRGDRVVVLTLDGAVSDDGAIAASVLLHLVEALSTAVTPTCVRAGRRP